MNTTRVTDLALIDRLWARAGTWERHFDGAAECAEAYLRLGPVAEWTDATRAAVLRGIAQ